MPTSTVPVDPSNVEQLCAWDGGEGAYWAANADYYDRAVAEHHGRLLAAAAIGATDRVLDIGCGTGQTTRDVARAATAGSALGVDLSSAMIEYATIRARRDGLTNVRFRPGSRPLDGDARVRPAAGGGGGVDERGLRAGRRAGAFLRGSVVRRCDQPDGSDVLR